MSSLIRQRLRLEAQRVKMMSVPLIRDRFWGTSDSLRRNLSLSLNKTLARNLRSCAMTSHEQGLCKEDSNSSYFPRSAAVSTRPVYRRPGPLNQITPTAGVLTTRSLRYMSSTSSSGGDLNPILPGNVLRSPLPDLELNTDLAVHQIVFDACDKYKDRLAVVCGCWCCCCK